MRKTIIAFLLGVFLTISITAYANTSIKLVVDGKEIYSDVPPQIINGRTLVPARPLAEAMGADVSWNEESQTVFVWTREWRNNTFKTNQPSSNQQNTQSNKTSETKEFSKKAVDFLRLCKELYGFAGEESNKNTSTAQDDLKQLESIQLELRSTAVPDEYKELKKLLLNMSYALQEAAQYKILYLESDNSYDRLSFITKRNSYLKQTVNLLADCMAEMDSLKNKGLL